MELPITRPSRIAYADELNFSELLGELKSKKYNGFIRVTLNSEEGHILFKNGKQVAASYDRDSKTDAIKRIKSATDDSNTVVEVFDLRESQVNYIMDVNKIYLIDSGSEVHDMLDELKRTETRYRNDRYKDEIKYSSVEEETPEIKEEVEPEFEIVDETESESVQNELNSMSETKSSSAEETTTVAVGSGNIETDEDAEIISEEIHISHEVNVEPEPINEEEDNIIEKYDAVEETIFNEPEIEEEPADRAELMKKYGLKDVGEAEVENILDSYKGGSLSDEDIEKIELTLMNKIKKSILGIPKIKGTEVMVFLDNAGELTGTINIITEYERKGFLSRIIGESSDLDNLKRQIINITQIEIRKSFRGFPEIVDNFKINVEVS